MDVNVKYSLGLLFLFGFLLNIYAQECTEIPNCKICGELGGVLSCLECDENFAQYNQKCCSKGCNTDFEGKHACDLDRGGICLFDSCLNTYYGDYCQPCSERIQNCDDCDLLKDTEVVQCTHCVSDFYLTANGQQCCPQGCASCIGTDGRTCTSCKQSYFLYNNSCDTCGNNCIPPTDGSARCDPDTGACYLGCRDGWHGRRCNVQCNLDNCVKCNYNEAADLLTCSDCIDGRYGINCDLCSANCAPSPQGNADICYQDGSCKHGCNKGYQGARCDVRCDGPIDMANCTVCERYSFLCTECKPGHWGQKCQYSCDSNCVGFQGNRLCAIADGTCDLGCLAGHYKANCSGSCPNCGQDVCNRDTGNCLDLICDPGFYGPACNSTCPVNCAPNPVTGNAYCDFTNGSCEYGCGDGYWGTLCNSGCSIHCAQSPSAVGTVTRPPCIQETGTCRYDCTPGYFGHDCLKNCISQCVDGTCDINSGQCEECNKGELAGPQCPFGTCPVGKYGQFCQVNCTERCRSACGRYNGTCFGCDPGFHGNNCEFLCGVCSSGSCDQKTGLCTTDCRNGFWNVYCNETCLYDGCETCFKGNGRCDICKVGFHGTNCDRTCSVYCARNSLDQVICEKETAACDEGKCLPGYWNRPCDITCNSNCRANANGERPCSLTNGACDLGCEDTYYGQQCNSRCSVYCIDRLCERDGRCALGCIDGRYGEMCELACRETCNNGQCNRTHGECEECNKPYQLQTELCRTAECRPQEGVYYYGINCTEICPKNCESSCQRSSSVCDFCVEGFWDPFCESTCGNCKETACLQNNGTCISDCKNGFFGFRCEGVCRYTGCEYCDRISGECIACKQGLWGDKCDQICTETCLPNDENQIFCNKENGYCDIPACINGFYNPRCTGVCSDNCLSLSTSPTSVGTCGFQNGICDDGCKQGWYGDFCNMTCSSTCLNRDCYRNGRCSDVLGCVDGFYGFACTLTCADTCNDGKCDRSYGNCTECAKPFEDRTDLCRDAACSPPKSGLFCNLTCAVNCQDGICTRYDQICNSCIDGFYGAECDIDCGNCKEGKCDQGTGECVGECEEGFYTPRCTVPCIEPGCQKCDRSSGTCIECKVGLWGTECESSCSPYCFPDVRGGGIFCDRDSAHCAANSCIPGYHGRDCTQECNEHCGLSTSGYRPCNIDTGVCDEDQCDPTWYGPLCNLNCPVNCKNRNCTRTGVCVEGCLTGYWGPMCRAICQPENTCNTGTCDQSVGECLECLKDEPTPLCRDAACSPINTWGVFCENDCPQNCADGTCSRKDGTCSSCVSERYGAKCDQACPNCKSNMCYQTDGACMDGGCDDGWYTLQCMTECKHEGCKDCDRTNGECITCKDGKYGLNCTLDCQRNCAPNAAGSITCNRFSGECDVEACKVGYYGRKCDLTCSEFCLNVACDIDEGTCELCRQGWYGQRCDGQCSPRCRNNDCEVTEDNCRQGCTDGYWGGSCEKTCNANCNLKACNQQSGECLYGCVGNNYYQLACSEPCSTNCVENVCNRTGYCMRGCKTGWYGDKCQFQCQAATKCTDGTCSRIGGVCEDCFDSNPGPNCPTADCPSGLKGAACEDLCNSTNCQFNRCERYTGACIACPLGYYGSLCDKTCFRCREGSGCDQTTGICDAGCEDGWYRPDCETKCSDVCGSCERNSGECVTCAPGRWGIACELLCSTNCNATNVGGIHLVFCEKATGACLEKACKVGYWGTDCTQVCSTNCLQDSNNNRVCSYEEGKCLIGCKSTFYGDQCDSLCSPRCRDQLCTNFRDSCNLNCADGYYGATCSGTCSPHCAGQGRCNPDNGTCFEGCEIGYYGPRCLPCKNTCLDGTCDTTGGCPDCLDPIGPQCRVQVCPTGLYGTTCESNCPGDYCQNNQCHRHKGTCENGCLEKYYGAYCTERCQCYEPGIISCNHTNGECICKPGRYGTKCDQTCSPGCSGNECDRTGTCTLGCLEGRYGARCDQSCTNCLSEACGAETGICLQGCVDGWYGPQCKDPCPVECKKCDIESGKCTTCADEYFPLDLCDKTCSSNCVRVGTSRVCSQANGECLNGCKLGYYGPDCSQTCGQCNSCNSNDGSCQVCNPGWWGTTCKSQCNSHCSRGGSSNERICRQSDGYCEFGCDPGFYGDTCSSSCTGINCAGGICNRQLGTCKEGCVAYFYGENCDNRCDSCKAGVCDQVNGNCIGDCPASFYGNKCDKECKTPICNDAICNKDSGFCDDCQLSPKGPRCSVQDAVTANPITQMEADDEVLSIGAIIGITVGSVCFVIIFVIVFVCCMNYKRRYDDAKTEIHLPSDVIERLSTHRSLHSTVSTNYPVARVVGDDEKDFVLF